MREEWRRGYYIGKNGGKKVAMGSCHVAQGSTIARGRERTRKSMSMCAGMEGKQRVLLGHIAACDL